MARNRKRAKERRARRPESVAAARARREEETPSPLSHATPDVELAEAQLEVGRPDIVEERERRQESLGEDRPGADDVDDANGRGELRDGAEQRGDEDDRDAELLDGGEQGTQLVYEDAQGASIYADEEGSPGYEDEQASELLDESVADDVSASDSGGMPSRRRARRGAGARSAGAAALTVPATAVPEGRPWIGRRLIHFLEGSWRELQRVQWPDRRQVAQATGVVIGFVIVAGLFLGLADFLSGKLVDFILK